MGDRPGMHGPPDGDPGDGGAGCLLVLLVIGVMAAICYKFFGGGL